jgi:hypothetical protein
MLRIKYELPASNYFLDNGELVFDLHVAIEGLVFTNGLPTTGEFIRLPDGLHLWTVLAHDVIYKIEGNRLIIVAVAPL